MGESKGFAKSSLKTNRIAMGREEREPIGPTLATDLLSTRNPTLLITEGEGSESTSTCSQNVFPSQGNREGEAVNVEEGTMVDLKRTGEESPKLFETTNHQSFEETKEEDKLISTPQTDRTTTLRPPDPTDDPRSDHHRSNGRVVGPRTALYRPYGRDGTMRLTSDCSTGQRPQHIHPDDQHRSHGQASCVRPDTRRSHGQPVNLWQSSEQSNGPDADQQHTNLQPHSQPVGPRQSPSRLHDHTPDPQLDQDRTHDRYADPQSPNQSHSPETNLQRPIHRPPNLSSYPQATRPITCSSPSCRDMVLSSSTTTSRDRDKLQGHNDQKPYGKEEPSFMVTRYTPASLQPQALQDQEEKLVKRKREAKGPRPKAIERTEHASHHGELDFPEVSDASTMSNVKILIEFYEGRKKLRATDHPESKTWTYGEPFSEKQTHFTEATDVESRKDGEISDLFTDGDNEKGAGDLYLGMTTQAPQEESRRNITFRRIRERREAPDQGNFWPRPPPLLCHPYGDSRPAPKPHPSRYHPPDPQTDGCDHNFFKRSRVSFSLSHQPLQDITNGIPHHGSQGECFETPVKVRIRVAGHDTTKKQEKEPDPMVVCNSLTYHESHPLRALEKGEIYKEEGDPPYETIEEELRGLNKARPKRARLRISSPSA